MRLFLPFSSRFFFYRVNLQPLGRIGFYQGGNCNSANRSSSRDHLHLSSFEHFAYAVFYTRQIAISDIGGSKDCNLFARRSTLFTPPFLFFLLLFFFNQLGDLSLNSRFQTTRLSSILHTARNLHLVEIIK